ncbi:MAG: hypothetical protein HY300_14920 [Verrucomicrobia bacterium]|nr:hypothetical protein [Verrucomicrobiota bacterium]
MNPATLCRLKKEARALLPFWAAIAGLMVVPFTFASSDRMGFTFGAYIFGCALLASVCIGHEFHHRTLGLLISQPVSRRRLWWEKMAVLGAALLSLAMAMALLAPLDTHTDWTKLKGESFDHILTIIAIWTLPPLIAFCTGPVLTMLARGTIGGVALTFLCPWALSILGFLLMPDEATWKSGQFSTGEVTAVFLCLFVVPCLYMGGLVLLGCRRFQRWEDANTLAQDISLPAQLTQPFAWLTERLTLGRGSALGQLVRKELRLQQPAFIVAAIFILLWLALVIVVFARPVVSDAFLILPSILLCPAIAIIAGVVSTAEERNLGVHEWHLTLPVSAARQWFVKVFVTLGVNALLGILLPWLLGHGATWMFKDPHLLESMSSVLSPLLIANLFIFCPALYASSASSNSTRALVGTIVIFIAVPVVFFPLMHYMNRHETAFHPLAHRLSQVWSGFVPKIHFG